LGLEPLPRRGKGYGCSLNKIPKGFRLEAQGCESASNPGSNAANASLPRRGSGLIPQIPFIPFHLMPAQKGPDLILERYLAMMFLLAGDISPHLLQIRLANREIGITTLPFEISQILPLFLNPEMRDSLQFLYPLGLRNGPTETTKEMNMIFNSADEQGRTVQLLRNTPQIPVNRFPSHRVA
jgi:hypothetical protein